MNIEDLQRICKSFRGVTEDVKWGNDLVFSVGSKMFCVAGLDQSPVSASFKATDDEFEELTAREGFKPAPYMAKHKWVLVTDIDLLSRKDWQYYIQNSHTLVSSKLPVKLKKELGLL